MTEINASDFGNSTKRRLPICFCLDTSGSMQGEPIRQLNMGLQNFLSSIKANDDTRSATDIAIITFGSSAGRTISGDLFISLDTVRTNAEGLGVTYEQELNRVVIHGILHLCGLNDKGPGEREQMEAAENRALSCITASRS